MPPAPAATETPSRLVPVQRLEQEGFRLVPAKGQVEVSNRDVNGIAEGRDIPYMDNGSFGEAH